ncbi:uncharacterized protein LOC134222924 [Armigeres subalbatus]|uniref:uncharacterized protein LOC134222924 n=1 Tax=Armigeres subalbatus TaxID=124917 RepID=UPI002ED12C93
MHRMVSLSSVGGLLLLVVAVFASIVAADAHQTPWILTLHQRRNCTDKMITKKICRGVVIDSWRILTVASCVRSGVDLVIEGSCGVPDWVVVNASVDPTADLAMLHMDLPLPPSRSRIEFLNFKKASIGEVQLDTTRGMQKVSLLEGDVCAKTFWKTNEGKLFIAPNCYTLPGSPLFFQESHRRVIIGLVSSIPEECNTTLCPIQVTDFSHYHDWFSQMFREEPNPSIKLPNIPATVVFSFLKLLAVISSLGGISFAFCCVMFLISN